mgnify:CR=1 FL=1
MTVHRYFPGRSANRSKISVALTIILAAALSLFVGPGIAHAAIGSNDYPYQTASTCNTSCVVDPWQFYERECTSFVAWRLNNDNNVAFSNNMRGPNQVVGHFGNAETWSANAVQIGYTSNSSPAPGAVAWYAANYHGAGSVGHVAYVDTVNQDGSITVEEYNAQAVPNDHSYRVRTILANSSTWPSGFIHVKDRPLTTSDEAGPAAVSWGNGRIDIFGRGAAGDLTHTFYDAATGWSTWESLGGGILGSPSAVSWQSGRLDVFVRGTDNRLYQKNYTIATGWSNFIDLGGTITSGPGAVSWGYGRIDIFARGPVGDLTHTFYDSATGWSTWESLGGGISGSPSAVSWQAGRLDAFVRGTDNHLYQKSYTIADGWTTWSEHGSSVVSGPGVVSWGPNRIDVFARGSAGDLTHTFYDSGWSTWESLAGGMTGAPSAVSWQAGRLDVFIRGTDNHLYQKNYLSASGWSPWVYLGGDLH